jgi:hypothetical protein
MNRLIVQNLEWRQTMQNIWQYRFRSWRQFLKSARGRLAQMEAETGHFLNRSVSCLFLQDWVRAAPPPPAILTFEPPRQNRPCAVNRNNVASMQGYDWLSGPVPSWEFSLRVPDPGPCYGIVRKSTCLGVSLWALLLATSVYFTST